MKIKSFIKTIYKTSLISSLISNIVSIIIVFLVCNTIVSSIYKSSYQSATDYLSDNVNHTIDNSNIFRKIRSFEEDKESLTISEIQYFIKEKSEGYNALDLRLYPYGTDFSQELPTNLFNIYSLFPVNKDIRSSIVNYSGELFIIDIIHFNDYIFLQFYNLFQSKEVKHLNDVNNLLGFYYNDDHVLLHQSSYSLIDQKKNLTLKTSINIPNLQVYFSGENRFEDQLILLSVIVLLSIFRFITNLLTTRRNIKRISKPLNDLVSNTEKLAAHEISEKLNRFDYPYHEFKQLAEAFNKVLLSRELSEIKLFRSFEQMESVVHKRTQELITTNEQLTVAIKKAEDANALKSQFLANISHEIRTPLNCIMGFCDIILTEDHSETVTTQVKQILHESETLLHLINDFLDYSRIDAGKMSIVQTELDIRSIVNSLLKSGQIQVATKKIELKSSIDEAVPQYILSDELRLYQVISNIFYNAIKFTPQGSVEIAISTQATKIENEIDMVIEIKDTGIGIPHNRIDSIFNKFEQVDGSLTRKYRGSGLGLTICKKIVDLMNGQITVKSEINKGSNFTVTIPVKVQQSDETYTKEPMDTEDSTKHTEGSRILLVEDYPVNQIVAKKHLEMDNHIVTIAENGQEALEYCEEIEFDLILMDLQMPVMDGFKATKYIRGSIGINRKTPILAMTANAMDTAKQTCMETGMNGIITKPIRKKMFLKEVDKWLKISNR